MWAYGSGGKYISTIVLDTWGKTKKGKHYEKCISPLYFFGQIILSGPNEASLSYPKIYHLRLWFNGNGVLREYFSALAIGKREMVYIFMIYHCDCKKNDYSTQWAFYLSLKSQISLYR